MKKIDMEAKLFLYILRLREQEEKTYSIDECDSNVAYVFDSYDSYKKYFISNGVEKTRFSWISNLCEMKETKKGSIIALKRLCDHAITRINQPGMNDTLSTYEEKLIESIKQYLPISYEKFRILDLSEQQMIVDTIKSNLNEEEQEMLQENFERLINLPILYAIAAGDRDERKLQEVKIMKFINNKIKTM